jgi:hypothetical protein
MNYSNTILAQTIAMADDLKIQGKKSYNFESARARTKTRGNPDRGSRPLRHLRTDTFVSARTNKRHHHLLGVTWPAAASNHVQGIATARSGQRQDRIRHFLLSCSRPAAT